MAEKRRAMHDLPAQPGHLAESKPFMQRMQDEASETAMTLQKELTKRRKVKLTPNAQLSAPLAWKAKT